MRVINEPVIVRFIKKHGDSRQWLENWLIMVRAARWQTVQELKQVYPAADGGVKVASGARVTVFDVCGNKYRLITDVNYAIQTVTILDLMTHAVYSSDLWKRRY